MEKETEFLSLYDYLGYPAGGELGKAVYNKARATNKIVKSREVETRSYKGIILLYTREFLDSYFNPTSTNQIDKKLPF